MPSPWAAFTSAPFFNSVLTASRSRAIAASATGAGPAALSHAVSAIAITLVKPNLRIDRCIVIPLTVTDVNHEDTENTKQTFQNA